MKKGIILCGGEGTRLRPLTETTNKHLLPVYDKQMVLYPLKTLQDMGITDILIVTGGKYMGQFIDLLGSGSKYGCNFTYKVQDAAGGIAQALLLAEDFVGDNQFAVILGDNVFEFAVTPPKEGCGLVTKFVDDPERFGVLTNGEIIEKPKMPASNEAVTGLYFYTPEIFEYIKTLKPSARGELEITDVNNWCLKNLHTSVTQYFGFWSDAGNFESLMRTANFASTK